MVTWQNRIIGQRAIKVADIELNPNNYRTHPVAQVAALRGVLSEIGICQGVIWNERTKRLIDGEARVLIAKEEGQETLVATVVNLSEEEEEKLLAALDPISALAGVNGEKLSALLDRVRTKHEGLQQLLNTLRRDADRALKMMRADSDGGISSTEEELKTLHEKWRTELGQLWRIGDHRLFVGDCTVEENYRRLIADEKPQMMVTDPPYGVNYEGSWRKVVDGNNRHSCGTVANDDVADWRAAWKLFDGNVAYVWHAGVMAGTVAESLFSEGLELRAQIIWRKPIGIISRGHYHWQHEPCWYSVRKGQSSHWCGDRSQSTVWDIPIRQVGGGEDMNTRHSTQKPLECMARPIQNHFAAGAIIYEPFCGSGTTMVACEKLGRRCRAMEINPEYAALILERMNLLGVSAELG